MRSAATRRAFDLATAAALAILVGLPFLFVVVQAIFPDVAQGSLSRPFAAARGAFLDPAVPRLVAHTLLLGGCVVLGTALLGAPLGAARGALRSRLARVIDLLLLIPFMIPPYLSTLGWILLLQRGGWLDQIAGLQADRFLFSFWGVVFVMTLNLFPLVYFAVARAAETAGGRLFAIGRVFGASPSRAFARILLPLIAPALLASLLLVFSATIEEFGAPAALAGQSGYFVLVTAIDRRVADYPIDLSGAAALSLALAGFALAAFVLQAQVLKNASFETIVGKSATPPGRARAAAPVLVTLALLALLSAGAPLLSIGLAASMREMSGGLRPGNFGLQNFAAVLSGSGGALGALAASLVLGATTAALTAALGFGAAVVIRRSRGPSLLSRLVAVLTVLPNATPGVVVAVGLILAWNQPALPVTPYGGWTMLVLAYGCVLLPYPARYASAALAQIGENLEPAAKVFGAGPTRALARITLPLVAPSLLSAMAIVFVVAARELVASTLLVPNGGQTVATFIWAQFQQGSLGEGMAMSLIAIAASTAALAAFFLAGRRTGAKE